MESGYTEPSLRAAVIEVGVVRLPLLEAGRKRVSTGTDDLVSHEGIQHVVTVYYYVAGSCLMRHVSCIYLIETEFCPNKIQLMN